MKFLLIASLFILFTLPKILPQYSKADSGLVRTTYTKQFDHGIIERYLNSGDTRKTKAALLSIAQSEDTLWVPLIVKLNFAKYGKEISFALGELGPCGKSSAFLIDRIKEKNNTPILIHEALAAIGKAGGFNSFNQILEYYADSGDKNTSGISLAMYGFYTRSIRSKSEIVPVIANEIKTHKLPCKENFEAAFVLFRTSAPDSIKDILLTEINNFLSPETVEYVN